MDLDTGPMHHLENSDEEDADIAEESSPAFTQLSEVGRSLIVPLLSFASFLLYATFLPDTKSWVGIVIVLLTTSISAMIFQKLSFGKILTVILESLPPL